MGFMSGFAPSRTVLAGILVACVAIGVVWWDSRQRADSPGNYTPEERDRLSQATQLNSHGSDLLEQAGKTHGEECRRLIASAVSSYREALLQLDREHHRRFWAMTQLNLAQALYSLGQPDLTPESLHCLEEAAAAQGDAVQLLQPDDFGLDLPSRLFQQATIWQELARRTADDQPKRLLLLEAVTTLRAVHSRFIAHNLGGEWTKSGEALLAALRALLKVSSEEESLPLRAEAAQLEQALAQP